MLCADGRVPHAPDPSDPPREARPTTTPSHSWGSERGQACSGPPPAWCKHACPVHGARVQEMEGPGPRRTHSPGQHPRAHPARPQLCTQAPCRPVHPARPQLCARAPAGRAPPDGCGGLLLPGRPERVAVPGSPQARTGAPGRHRRWVWDATPAGSGSKWPSPSPAGPSSRPHSICIALPKPADHITWRPDDNLC